MPIFFWWSGRGIWTPLIVLGTMTCCALLLNIFRVDRLEGPLFWGVVIVLSAVPNWFVGTRLNRRKRGRIRSTALRDRLLYRAPNKFLSLPMETFSFVIVAVGLVIIVAALI